MAQLGRLFRTIALPVILLALWWVLTENTRNFYFPPLATIVSEFANVWTGDRIFGDVVPSLWRLAAGYGIAGFIGIVLGTMIGLDRRLAEFLEPLLEFFRAIPPSVLVPIFMIVAGLGDSMKILVIVSGCVWPTLLNSIDGVRGRDAVMDDVVHVYRIARWQRICFFLLPAASPSIFIGLRQSLAIAIILMVISEMFASSNGLGFTIVQFQRSFAIPEMWTGIILLGLIGVVVSALFKLVEDHYLRWYVALHAMHKGTR